MSSEVEQYLASKGILVKKVQGDDVNVPCFFCNEDPSKRGRLYINTVIDAHPWFCHLCGRSGGWNLIRKHFGDPPLDQNNNVLTGAFTNNLDILRVATDYYVDRLCDNLDAFNWLKEERGLTAETISKHKLGWADGNLAAHLKKRGFSDEAIKSCNLIKADGSDFFVDKITIPYMVNGQVLQIRGKDPKAKYHTPPGDRVRPYNIDAARDADVVVVTEGEFDALVVEQMGYNAIGVPGANSWQEAWNGYLESAKKIYAVFDRDDAGAKGYEKLSKLLGARVRQVLMPEHKEGESKNDPSEWIVKKGHSDAEFAALIAAANHSLLVSVNEAYNEWLSMEGNAIKNRKSLGFNLLDHLIDGGMQDGQVAIMLARTGVGKALASDMPVATPDGWREIGDLSVGDYVIGSNGKPTIVTGVFPQGIRKLYEVKFSDGATVVCDKDHLWCVRNKHHVWRVETLASLMEEGFTYADGQRCVFVPLVEPVQYPKCDLPMDPYLMGVLLGDGSFRMGTPVISSADPYILESVREKIEPLGLALNYVSGFDYRLSGRAGKINPLTEILRELGLWGHRSESKFIPQVYMTASVEDRIALVQGLMDTDGYGKKNEFSSSSKRMVEQFAELVRSLGGVIGWSGKGIRKKSTTHLDSYSCTIQTTFNPYRLPRKRELWSSPIPCRAILSAEEVGDGNATCISVAAEDRLFVTKDYIVTHNTITLVNMFHRIISQDPSRKILFFSLEQTRNEWFDRALKIYSFYNPPEPETQEDVTKWRQAIFDRDERGRLKHSLSSLNASKVVDFYKNNLMIVDKNKVTEEDVRMCIDEFIEVQGEKPYLVAIDYLGYWARAFKGEAYERTTAAVMKLKEIGKDVQVPLLSPHQVNRMANDQRLDITSSRDSGAVEETADFLFGLQRITTQAQNDRGTGMKDIDTHELALDILKSRHGGKGSTVKLTDAPLSLTLLELSDSTHKPLAELQQNNRRKGENLNDYYLRLAANYFDSGPNWRELALKRLEDNL